MTDVRRHDERHGTGPVARRRAARTGSGGQDGAGGFQFVAFDRPEGVVP